MCATHFIISKVFTIIAHWSFLIKSLLLLDLVDGLFHLLLLLCPKAGYYLSE